jgi:cyclic pyranopterin phosphate synthase
VLDGIAAARTAGIAMKLNAVIVRGINEDEILPLARYAAREGLPLRYIEFMPLDGRGEWSKDRVVTQAEIVEKLGTEFDIAALPRGNDPAAYFRLLRRQGDGGDRENGGAPEVGIISTVSNPFCASCDRLRLTADGALYPCLFSKRGTSLRDPLRAGASDEQLAALIRETVWNKDAGYATNPGYADRPIAMNSLGG